MKAKHSVLNVCVLIASMIHPLIDCLVRMSDCPLCFEAFNETERCPRLLECGHTFCSACLQRVWQQGSVSCPQDRRTFKVAAVDQLAKNWQLLQVIASVPPASWPVCTVCVDHHPAVAHCTDCDEHMCQSVADVHVLMKATRNHRVEKLPGAPVTPAAAAPAPSAPSAASADPQCGIHHEPFKYWDVQCGRLLCVDCAVLQHVGHKCQSLSEAAGARRGEVAALLARADKQVGQLQSVEGQVAGALQELDRQHAHAVAQVRAAFEQVRRWRERITQWRVWSARVFTTCVRRCTRR